MEKRALVTAGPTREYLDPVRFLSNKSSGRMGYLVAEVLCNKGYKTTILSGPTGISAPAVKKNITVVQVESALEMFAWVRKYFNIFDVIVSAAAVADYRPSVKKKTKIKSGKNISIQLVKNPDILKWLGKNKREGQILTGFALEDSSKLIKNAKLKLKEKKCDLIIANPTETMESEFSKAKLIFKSGEVLNIPKMRKEKLAALISAQIYIMEMKKNGQSQKEN